MDKRREPAEAFPAEGDLCDDDWFAGVGKIDDQQAAGLIEHGGEAALENRKSDAHAIGIRKGCAMPCVGASRLLFPSVDGARDQSLET